MTEDRALFAQAVCVTSKGHEVVSQCIYLRTWMLFSNRARTLQHGKACLVLSCLHVCGGGA
eukprot:6470731-Amphidinium_carterae.1